MNEQIDHRQLPADLPTPGDDGAARHLIGMRLPDISLRATSGALIKLSDLPRRTVLYAYPRTGVPGIASPEGWDAIPGARGCTVEALAFKDHRTEIADLGADVFGLSTQVTDYQREMVERLHLPFPVLSDADLVLTHALRLPTMQVAGDILLKRLTMVSFRGAIEQVFYPVFPPNEAATTVITWLKRHGHQTAMPLNFFGVGEQRDNWV